MYSYYTESLTTKEIDEIMELYCACFVDDGFYRATFAEQGIVGDENVRAKMLSQFTPQILAVLECGASYGIRGDNGNLVAIMLNFGYQEMLKNNSSLFLSIFGENGELQHADDLHGTVQCYAKAHDIVYLLAVAVLPEYRRRHLASLLLDTTIMDNPGSLVVSDVSNVDSLGMYRKRGFIIKRLGPGYNLVIGPNLSDIN